MIYQDDVYGRTEITEPVILEIIQSPALRRLDKIYQGGYGYSLSLRQATRFQHSVGVMLLLRKFGASLEEQLAGLIHDVSHSAFSHTIDYALKDIAAQKEQSHQDLIFSDYVRKQTQLPGIFKKYKIDLEQILDDTNWPLKEKDLPDLCADRIDYVLRDGYSVASEEINPAKAQYLLDSLRAKNGQWFFTNQKTAQAFADYFSQINKIYYSGLATGVMFKIVGEGLRYLLANKLLSVDDLYVHDEHVIAKMKEIAAQDQIFQEHWQKMNNQQCYLNDSENYEHEVWVKSRAVDPLFFEGGNVRRLSEANPQWLAKFQEELKPKHYFLRYQP